MIRFFTLIFFLAPVQSFAETKIQNCGSVSFNKNMNCESAEIYFDISKCDNQSYSMVPATKITCERSELVAKLKKNDTQYVAVFVKSTDGMWAQKGTVTKT